MHPLSQEKVNISPDENMVVIYLFFGAVRRFLLSLETWGGGLKDAISASKPCCLI